jgi:hypothetical protein
MQGLLVCVSTSPIPTMLRWTSRLVGQKSLERFTLRREAGEISDQTFTYRREAA